MSPFHYQVHLHDRDQPQILGLFEQLRSLVDEYGAFTVAEIADVDSFAITAKYTGGTARLHTGYSFPFTFGGFGVERCQRIVRAFEEVLRDGWTTYAFSNHDVERVVSRWGALPELSGDRAALAKLLLACLFTMRGNACLYQGEELGLTEASLPRECLVDPWGIEFWPVFKGRDGCRTPMPWQARAPGAGFTTGEPWLPVPDEHRSMAVDVQEADPSSVLAACRQFIHFRKAHRALVTGTIALRETSAPIWAFERAEGAERLLCVFNLSNRPATWTLDQRETWRPLDGHGFAARLDGKTIHLPAFGAFFGERI